MFHVSVTSGPYDLLKKQEYILFALISLAPSLSQALFGVLLPYYVISGSPFSVVSPHPLINVEAEPSSCGSSAELGSLTSFLSEVIMNLVRTSCKYQWDTAGVHSQTV